MRGGTARIPILLSCSPKLTEPASKAKMPAIEDKMLSMDVLCLLPVEMWDMVLRNLLQDG